MKHMETKNIHLFSSLKNSYIQSPLFAYFIKKLY